MEHSDQTFLEKAEEAKKRIENWPDWKKRLYENILETSQAEANIRVSTIDETAFRSKILGSFSL